MPKIWRQESMRRDSPNFCRTRPKSCCRSGREICWKNTCGHTASERVTPMKFKRHKPECCIYGCDRPSFCYGRCHFHFADLKSHHGTELFRLKGLARAERNLEFAKSKLPPKPQPWEYEPSPEKISELIAQFGGTDHAK